MPEPEPPTFDLRRLGSPRSRTGSWSAHAGPATGADARTAGREGEGRHAAPRPSANSIPADAKKALAARTAQRLANRPPRPRVLPGEGPTTSSRLTAWRKKSGLVTWADKTRGKKVPLASSDGAKRRDVQLPPDAYLSRRPRPVRRRSRHREGDRGRREAGSQPGQVVVPGRHPQHGFTATVGLGSLTVVKENLTPGTPADTFAALKDTLPDG